MYRLLVIVVALLAALALPAATPAAAQDGQAACLAEMQATVRPLLEQAGQFSPEGVRGQGFAPLTRPFAPPFYGSRFGPYPTAPWLPAPTAAYNASAQYTGYSGLPQPGFGFPVAGPGAGVNPNALAPTSFLGGAPLTSQNIGQFLAASGQLNLTSPQFLSPQQSQLLVALANLQQTEQARTQQQALLQQQQGLYLNSLYQLSASYQVTALDWAEAYSTLAQAWMSYYRDLCRGGADSGASFSAPASPVGSPTQNLPGFPTR